ncbi:hypothetical protein [Microlunatus soli]|uniref:Uncharacterized protein n=1 Tax=Microlunatus soli TaxID=630515 RepID=A0A1H1THH7_9ACTN|nr:hypothetical protein [Microlunatus soli]SDS59668.1 hypothetical protein SAMN04489812_2395 [Microlunatus soli]
MTSYVLTADRPLRASAISAVLDLIGAVLIVVGLDRSLAVLVVIGIVLFALGITLAVAAAVVRHRLRTEVRLGPDEIVISSAGRTARARWAEISGVTTDDHVIYLARDSSDAPDLKINSPRGTADPEFARLSAELADRLDDDRGYHSL